MARTIISASLFLASVAFGLFGIAELTGYTEAGSVPAWCGLFGAAYVLANWAERIGNWR